MPKRSPWRVVQFDTLRLRLIKIAARVVELKTMIRLHLPTACPDQAILRVVLGRTPRLFTCPPGPTPPCPEPVPSIHKPHCSDRRPRTGAGQAMPATLTRRHMEPLEQAGSRYAELMRLGRGSVAGADDVADAVEVAVIQGVKDGL